MMLRISGLFGNDELLLLQRRAAKLAFADGAATAGWHAKLVKKNEQAHSDGARPLLEEAEQAMRAHPVFMAAARPKRFVRMLLSRYKASMEYGLHVDDALMDGERTDLSFTLFLSEPASYEGGALVLSDTYAEREVKLPAGELILYPSTSLHKVTPVTSGERLAIVGWVRSHVRLADDREVLFDLENAISEVFAREGKSALFDTLTKTRSNLLRRFAD